MVKLNKQATFAGGAALGIAAGVALYRIWANASGAADPSRVGYPPLATIKNVDEGVWIVDDVITASGLPLPIRMTVVRLSNGALLLHSPTPFTPALGASLGALGAIRHFVAPTFAHWTNLAGWQEAYPDATTWAVPGLRDRGQVRRSGTRIDVDLADNAPPQWGDDIQQGIVAGGNGFREAYLFHKPTRTLIVSDLIENLEPEKLPPVTRIAARAFAGTRGTTALHVRGVLRLGGDEAKDAIREIVATKPGRVILAHGLCFENNAAQRLCEAFAWLVNAHRRDPADSAHG
jgi:hypothetical protein